MVALGRLVAAAGLTGSDVLVDGGLMSDIYALDSVEATGWKAFQNETLDEVRKLLAEGSLRPAGA